MRILILSQYYPPEPAVRLKDLTTYLIGKGHTVEVLTTYPSYPLGKVYDGYKLGLKKKFEELGAKVTRVYAKPYRGTSARKRGASYFSFAASAFLLGLLPRRRPDVIYVYHPPLTTGLAAAMYQTLSRVPFLYDVEDVWPDAIVAAGMLSEGGRPYRMIRKMEDYVYRHAAIVTVISEGMKANLLGKRVPESKLRIISNWGNPEVYFPQDATVVRKDKGWNDKFIVMVAGNLTLTHGLETILEAAEILKQNEAVGFVFLGSGAAKESLMQIAKDKALPNVQFLERVPDERDAAMIINGADTMLVHIKDVAKGDFSVPHRIFSYMLCGKPIIVASEGSTAELVRELKSGWICKASDPQALADTVLHAATHPQEVAELGTNGLATSKGPFSRDHLLSEIEQALIQIARKK